VVIVRSDWRDAMQSLALLRPAFFLKLLASVSSAPSAVKPSGVAAD